MRNRTAPTPEDERGLVITLVAVVLLFVVGAMAALAIDVATFYSTRTQAQLVADSAALAGARVLANSGFTSTTSDSTLNAAVVSLCQNVATSLGQQNLSGAQITVTCTLTPQYDPTVSVQVQSTAPTFFARIWGRTQVTVAASAVAEAYNPSGNATIPVAPLCAKPWLLPNLDPIGHTAHIFNRDNGLFVNAGLTGQSWTGLSSNLPGNPPAAGQYYLAEVGSNSGDFPEPAQALPSCSSGLSKAFQIAVAGCVPLPIACGTNRNFNVDQSVSSTTNLNADTEAAIECLIHYNSQASDIDSLNGAPTPAIPFTFTGGTQNPITGAAGKTLIVSDSLVTVPVYDCGTNCQALPQSSVTVIGFLQLFLNPQPVTMPPAGNQIPVTIINQVGCGGDASGTPIYGNGPSAVAVRLTHK